MEIIPAIDLLDGGCVRLYQGDFDKVSRYEVDPLVLASRYRAAGLRRLHVVDLDGARDGVPLNLEVIGRLAAESGMTVQAGGGVRSRNRVTELLSAGVDRVVLGSLAILECATIAQWLKEIPATRLVLAFDVRLDEKTGDPMAVTHGWRKASARVLWDLMDFYLPIGARDFLCTDVSRDGTLTGPNTALYRKCVQRYPDARFIASGGLSSMADIGDLAASGVSGVVTGKALLDGRISLGEIGQFSRDE